jgi:hypothetical protein
VQAHGDILSPFMVKMKGRTSAIAEDHLAATATLQVNDLGDRLMHGRFGEPSLAPCHLTCRDRGGMAESMPRDH